MGNYRDDRSALREAQADLEAELQAREEQLAEREAELAKNRDELAAKDAELAELRLRVAPEAPEPDLADALKVCADCGRQNKPHFKFCLNCGEDLAHAQRVAPQAEAPSVEPIPASTRRALAALMLVLMVAGVAAGFFLSLR